MMLIGFVGLGFAGYRSTKEPQRSLETVGIVARSTPHRSLGIWRTEQRRNKPSLGSRLAGAIVVTKL
jgi:hypothetical protein